MKIAYILPSLAHCGPVLVAKDIVSQIHKEADVDVYYFDDIVQVKFDCPVYKIDFAALIPFEKYDIIHSHMYRPDKYVWKNRKKIRGKTISTLHCHIGKGLRYEYNIFVSLVFTLVWIFFLRNHTKAVALNKNVLNNYYRHLIQKEKLTYVYNGVQMPVMETIDAEDKNIIQSLKEKKYKIIGANALLTKTKGLHLIISVLPLLDDYAFIILGKGKEKKNLENLSKKLGVADRCYFLGFKKNATSYLPFYDVYAMPSLSEEFGLALIEAAFLKRSCICSDIPTFFEMFTDEEVTFFNLKDKESLKNAIQEAYEKREEKGEKAYKRTVNNYTAEIMGKKYLDLYKSLMGE